MSDELSSSSAVGAIVAPADDSSDAESEEDFVPAAFRLVQHTSYQEIKKNLDSVLVSKRATRDAENIDHFIKEGTKSGCARVDAVYTVQRGATKHIKVQDEDEYWAELEHRFPYLYHEAESS